MFFTVIDGRQPSSCTAVSHSQQETRDNSAMVCSYVHHNQGAGRVKAYLIEDAQTYCARWVDIGMKEVWLELALQRKVSLSIYTVRLPSRHLPTKVTIGRPGWL